MSNIYEVSDTKKMMSLIEKIRGDTSYDESEKYLHAEYRGSKKWVFYSFTSEGKLNDLTENEMNNLKGLCVREGIGYKL